MLTSYIQNKLAKAKYKILDDGTYFGSIPGISGVWANAKTLDTCHTELQSVFEEWMLFSLKKDKKIPGFSFVVSKKIYA